MEEFFVSRIVKKTFKHPTEDRIIVLTTIIQPIKGYFRGLLLFISTLLGLYFFPEYTFLILLIFGIINLILISTFFLSKKNHFK